MTGDPIYTLIHEIPNWNVLFVEPVPYLFESLKSNYASREGLIFENNESNIGMMFEFSNLVKTIVNSLYFYAFPM